ncbi:hypothetical protein V5O48_013738 [Marasmius crinis-equi]|uniref:Uncharacterized protein n=1 Tax=Marasmius crinis-equi TaxID=585013 RepID=A0ABR3EZ88_9AGAR
MSAEFISPQMLKGTLSSSKTKQQRREESPPIYLFVPPLSTRTFWSFDPDGQNPITADHCHYLGLPISLKLECRESCRPTKTYQALQAYQTARGFDPNTTEFARHNQYPIYEIIKQPLPSRFEEIEDLEESQDMEESEGSETTETPLQPVHPEELDNVSLGVVFGDDQPKDLAANTTTQSHALQKGAGYSSPAAPSSASTNSPRVETAEIDCTLSRGKPSCTQIPLMSMNSKSVSPSAEISPHTHSKDLKAVSAETEIIIPQPPTDIILSISSINVQSILRQEKTTYELVSKRSTSPPTSVRRIWFYVTAPESSISYICEVGTMTTTEGKTKRKKRKTSDCVASFPITRFYRLHQPLALPTLKRLFRFKSAPRGGTMLRAPTTMLDAKLWYIQELIWSSTQAPIPAAEAAGKKARMKRKASKVADADGGEETDVDVAWITERLRSLQLTDQNSSVVMRDPACDAMDVD